MKGHMRKHRETGGVNEAEKDLKEKNMEYTKDANVNREAVEKKRGGRAKKKVHEMHVLGEHAKHHAGRKPRKQGGGTYSDSNPFTSAKKGTPAPGRKLEMEMD